MFDEFEFELFFGFIGLVLFIFSILKLTGKLPERDKNRKFPIQSITASVVSKRTSVSYAYADRLDVSVPVTRKSKTVRITDSALRYYVTFKTHGKESLELEVDDDAYRTLHEGETGKLTFQGKRYHGFERE